MNNKNRVLALCLGLAASAASLTSSADALDDVRQSGVLEVATEMQFAPFDFHENGEQAGLNKAIFAEVGKELGVEIEFIDLPWPSVLPGLEAGNFDIVAGPIIVTQARKARYHFLTPIAESTVALLKRAGDDSIESPEDIAGKTAGGGQSSAQLAALKAYAETLDEPVEIKEFVDNNQAYAALASGRIDAVANSLPNIGYVASQRSNVFKVVQPPFGEPSYFAYLGRDDEESRPLLDVIDEVLLKMKDDGRLAELQKQWLGQAMDTPRGDFEPNI
ncbi:transporter substrate-binding domain-containing protein [Salinicola peritrichatus]|uniref:transporter substrate-binding domain-containing protein n=1 Tax=Salinicola peritrichatus TaxID=1267424 RepID=UPI000DA12446|nr:transporter substrate-binding domain-containing protein [Salinicola peritrichatus]